jgi:hypothetical protein
MGNCAPGPLPRQVRGRAAAELPLQKYKLGKASYYVNQPLFERLARLE